MARAHEVRESQEGPKARRAALGNGRIPYRRMGKSVLQLLPNGPLLWKDALRSRRGGNTIAGFWGHTIVHDDGSSDYVPLDADHLAGSLIFDWGEGTWIDVFSAACGPGCTFVGEEPTKVAGGPRKFIALVKEVESERVYHLSKVSNAGEATLRMGKAWAVVNI